MLHQHLLKLFISTPQQLLFHAVCRILVGVVPMIFFCTSAVRADEKDSLRSVLATPTLGMTSRAEALERLVVCYMDAKPDSAVYYAWQLYHIATKDTADKNLMASALTALVNGYQNYDKSDKVLEYGFQLLILSEAIHDTARIGRALFAIGHASGQLSTKNTHGENIEALNYLQRALDIAKRLNDKRLTTECNNAIGRIYRKEQQFDTAMIYHRRALVLAEKYHFPFQQAWALSSLAVCYENNGNLRLALEYALASLTSHKEGGIETVAAIPLFNIARIYQKLGNLPQALVYAKQSFFLANISKNRAIKYMSCERLALIYEALGDSRNALAYQKRFVVIRDSVSTIERAEDLSRLQTALDYDHNKREYELHIKKDEALTLAVKRQQIIIAFVVIGSLFLTLAIILLLRGLRRSKLLNQKLQAAMSERIEMGEKLNEKGQHLETIIASLDDIIFEFNDRYQFLNVWCADKSVLFLPPEQFLGKTFKETFGAEFAQIFEPAIVEAFSLGAVQRVEYKSPFANEQPVRWFEGKIVPIKTKENEERRVAMQVSDITERKQRVQDLHLIYNAINRSSDAISVIRASTGKLVFANDRLCTNLSRSREELLQTSVQQLETIFEQPGAWESHITDMRKQRAALVFGEQKRSDGSTFPVEVAVSLIDVEDDEFEVVITRDITERKQTEERILSQSRFITSVTNAIPGILSYWTADLRCTFANTPYLEWFGRSLEEVIGIELQELLGESLFKKNESFIRAALKGKPQQFERETIDENGESRYSLVQYIPDVSEDRVLGFIFLATDITSTKKTQNSLKEAQRLAKIGSWEWDITLNTLTWSDEQFHIFGEDIHSYHPTFENYFSHFTEEEQKRTAILLHEAISGSETYSIEHEITRRDGSRLLVVEQATVVYDDAKKPIRMLGTTQDISQRKNLENKILSSERLYRSIVELPNSYIIRTDLEGKYTYANSAHIKKFGMGKTSLLGTFGLDHIIPEDHEKTRVAVEECLYNPGTPVSVVLRKPTIDGPVWTEWIFISVADAQGSISEIQCIGHDITELKQAEIEIQKLSLVARHTTNLVVITDTDGHITWVNEAFMSLTEYSFAEALGKKPGHLLQGINTDPLTIQTMREAVQQGEGFEVEILNYSKSKQPYWIHIKTDPIINNDGILTGYFAIQTNITERKRAEEEQFQKLSLVASKTTNAVIITDANGLITWVNDGFTKITEYSLEDVLGKKPGSFLQGTETDPTTVQAIRDALYQTKSFEAEILNYTKSKRPYWLHIKTDPFYDDDGLLAGFVAIETDITERKQQDLALLESEERYRLIFAHSSEGVLQTLPNGTIETANPEACRILGRSKEELVGLSRADVVDMTDARLPALRKERREKGYIKGELNFVRNDGTVFPGEFSSTIYTDAHGKEHIAVFLRDVSERKAAEESIRKSEARLSTALQALSEGIVIYENGISTQTMNASALRILGLSKEQLNQQAPLDPHWKAVHEDGSDFPFEEYPLMLTLKTGKPQSNVIMGVHKADSTQSWISINSRPLLVEGATELSGVVVSFTDITDRKLAEKHILFQTELLNSIVLSMTDGVVLVDEHRSIVLANPAAEAMFGYSSRELLSQPLSLLIPQQSHIVHERHIQTFLGEDTGIPHHKMHTVLGKRNGGETFAMEASIAQFTVDGKLFLLAVVRDITKRLEAEEEILQLNRTLTQRVEERTADLVRLNKEKDEFLGIAAHDLKNPLAAIRSSAQIIEECFIAGEEVDFAEYADSIIATADEMLEIITNFLDIELIENGKLGLALERLSLEIVGRTVESHRKRAAAKGIMIHYEELRQPLSFIADRLALKQVLNNLLSNAVKFSPKGKNIVVRMEERRDKDEEQHHHESPYRHTLRIAIQDEGPGVSADEQSSLFTKFARLSAKPTGEEGSTGLGLSIVKRLVEMMNGRVWCESTPGKGATFIIELPVV